MEDFCVDASIVFQNPKFVAGALRSSSLFEEPGWLWLCTDCKKKKVDPCLHTESDRQSRTCTESHTKHLLAELSVTTEHTPLAGTTHIHATDMPQKSAPKLKGRRVWTVSSKAEPLPRGSVAQQNMTKLATIATRSTATRTAIFRSDRSSMQQWRSIQGKYWLELQRLQHSIQPHPSAGPSSSGTAPGLSPLCKVEMATSSTPISPHRHAFRLRAPVQRRTSPAKQRQRTTRKRTRRNQRRTRNEESSSLDAVDMRRKRPRSYKWSQFSCLTHLQIDTSLHFHITTLNAHGLTFNRTCHRERAHIHLTIPQLPAQTWILS